MGTVIEEIFSKKLGRQVKAGEIVIAEIDYIMSHDNTTPLAINAFKKINKKIKDPRKIVLFFDHAYPPPNIISAENQKKIREFAHLHNIRTPYTEGICHQLMIEKGYVQPGRIIIGGDSHTNTYGAFGCFSTGMGSTEIGVSWITGKTWFRIPETINIVLSGKTKKDVFAKDVMLYIAGKLGMDGATYKSLEFSGSYIDNLEMHERIIFANMSTEVGAKCGLIASDKKTIEFLQNHTEAEGDFEIITAVNPNYEKTIEIDVSQIPIMVSCHPTVDNVKKLSELQDMEINEVFIGTCTNARYEDLEIAASILKGKKVHDNCRTIITPATLKIYNKAMENGLIKIFNNAGCTVTMPGCGACIGRHGGILAESEKAFTTMNRNFIGRMGSADAEIYLGSPAAAAATAINGKITSPEKYL